MAHTIKGVQNESSHPEVKRARFSVDLARSVMDWLSEEILVRFKLDWKKQPVIICNELIRYQLQAQICTRRIAIKEHAHFFFSSLFYYEPEVDI